MKRKAYRLHPVQRYMVYPNKDKMNSFLKSVFSLQILQVARNCLGNVSSFLYLFYFYEQIYLRTINVMEITEQNLKKYLKEQERDKQRLIGFFWGVVITLIVVFCF